MTNSVVTTCCPHLGLAVEPTVMLDQPTPGHRCYVQNAPFAPDLAQQESFCLNTNYTNCGFYTATTSAGAASMIPLTAVAAPPKRKNILLQQPTLQQPASARAAIVLLKQPAQSKRTIRLSVNYRPTTLTLASISLTLCLILVSIVVSLQTARPSSVAAIQPPKPIVLTSAGPSPVPPTVTRTRAVDGSLHTAVLLATPTALATPTPPAPPTVNVDFATPTAEPGGQVLLLAPKAGGAGWWKSKDTQRNHVGDSYLYAGTDGDETFISAVRFDLSKVPRGAPIRQAQVRLTGLRQDQLQSTAKGIWLVQLVPERSSNLLGPADFLTMLSAPAALTLFPPLAVTDLATARVNQWELDETTRQWLAAQLLEGATSVTLRLQAAIEQGEALFAWDSGLGPETGGDAPTLFLSLGPPPPTPPPLPTKPFIVATLTPVPDDILTVVALAETATAVAFTTGTYTPAPYVIVTPTPFPANLETVQAVAAALQLPPVVLETPLPASSYLATRAAQYATAVALTTGTFTPVPTGYVTPILVAPSPPAENVATEAARVVAATAAAASGGPTATPLPYNAVIAVYVYATAVPGNAATALADGVIATAAAKVNGTPTPLPWNALIITPVPTATPLPPPTATPLPPLQLATELTATPTPVDPVNLPDSLPANLAKKILFKTNRGGSEETYALDPLTGDLYRVNEPWIYPLAQKQLPFSPDGRQEAIVKAAADRTLQIHIYVAEYNSLRQITALTGADIGRTAINYDPAWSPQGDRIAFVSTNNGNDEIYVVTVDGTVVKQLTNNKFEWDKHPSWSPDGNQLVFFSNRESGRRQLWLMNADGSAPRNLSNNVYEDWDPIWVK